MGATEGFRNYAERCPYRTGRSVERRPGNALNVEIGAPMPRCKLRTPKHWPEHMTAARWIMSGGDCLVFGLCSHGGCPLKPDFCECGHMGTTHMHVGNNPRYCTAQGCSCGHDHWLYSGVIAPESMRRS
jgi:hypothetical protein